MAKTLFDSLLTHHNIAIPVQPCLLDWHGYKHVPLARTNEFGNTRNSPLCDKFTTAYPYPDANSSKIVYYFVDEGHGRPISSFPWCRYCKIAVSTAAFVENNTEVFEVLEVVAFNEVNATVIVRAGDGSNVPVEVTSDAVILISHPDPLRGTHAHQK